MPSSPEPTGRAVSGSEPIMVETTAGPMLAVDVLIAVLAGVSPDELRPEVPRV